MKWSINALSVLNTPAPQTVVMSHFTIDQDGQMVTYSVNLLPASKLSFTSYADITEDQAIQWTKEALGANRVLAMETEVQVLIDAQQSPMPQSAPLPWSTVSYDFDGNY